MPPQKRGGALLSVVGTLLAVLLLVAAGIFAARAFRPTAASNNSDARERTLEIARSFGVSRDAVAARLALAELPVANANQWLLFTTEEALANPQVDDPTRRALVSLALELGLNEAGIVAFAQSAGLIERSGAEAATIAAAMSAPVAAQPSVVAADEGSAAPVAGSTEPPAAAAPVEPPPAATAAANPAGAPAAEPTAQPVAGPAPAALTATTTQLINLRSGPGTNYATAGSMGTGDTVELVARSAAGDWLQVKLAGGATAWVYAELVNASGSTAALAVATDIPAPPPVATPAPIAAAPTAAPAAPPPADPAAPAPEPTATLAPAANPGDTPTFHVAARRMWNKDENGTCQGQHLLRINVIDAAGNPINGVTLQGVYTGFTATTGDQGKGDGRIEFDLYGSGEAFKVVRNNDGHEAVSEEAGGFTTRSLDIDIPTLIGGGYCTDAADCQVFYNSFGCTGHHSWEATFQRNY